MFGLGFTEILVILCVVLIVLGPERLPEFARTMGRTMAEFRRAADQFRSEVSLSSLEIDKSILRDEVEEIKRLALTDLGESEISSPQLPAETELETNKSDSLSLTSESDSKNDSAEPPCESSEKQKSTDV